MPYLVWYLNYTSRLFRKIAHIGFSVWLAMLLLLGTTPKEFIHLFVSHKDTVHKECYSSGFSYEKPHHHCSFLNFNLMPFAEGFHVPYISFSNTSHYTSHTILPISYCIQTCFIVLSLRGPPFIA